MTYLAAGGDLLGAGDTDLAAWLERAREGDATAWSRLYNDVAPLVIGYLRAQRLPDPDDVAGEVMLEVVRDLHRFSGGQDGFRSWVLAIAHHRLLDARRRGQRRPAVPTPTEELDHPTAVRDGPEAQALANDAFGRLAPALEELTEDQRSVLLLRVIGDLSVADVARITGKRAGAVKQLQRRAVQTLRRQLDERAPVGERDTRTQARVQRNVRDVAVPGSAPSTGWLR